MRSSCLLDECWRGRHAGRHGKHFVTGLSNQYRMLPLCRQAAILGLDRPAVTHLPDFAATGINHWFDRENHARHKLFQRPWSTVVEHLRLLMEYLADAMAAKLAYHAVSGFLRILLNHVANIAEMCARFDLGNA